MPRSISNEKKKRSSSIGRKKEIRDSKVVVPQLKNGDERMGKISTNRDVCALSRKSGPKAIVSEEQKEMTFWLNESSVNTGMTRIYGRSS